MRFALRLVTMMNCAIAVFLLTAGCAVARPPVLPDGDVRRKVSPEEQTAESLHPLRDKNPNESSPGDETPSLLPESPEDRAVPPVVSEPIEKQDASEPEGNPEQDATESSLAEATPSPLSDSTAGGEAPLSVLVPMEDKETPEPGEKSDQELLDSALEFCRASNDFWDAGDLDNALDALDRAYSLVLQVDSGSAPEILQQRDDLRVTIAKRIVECYSSRSVAANGYHKAIPLVMNEHVERALKVFTGKGKDFFLAAYRRSGRYRPAIVKALEEAGMPEELSWLPLIESGFKVRALSRARALGIWQFIASTGYKYGLKRDHWVDERMDPEKSTEAAIAYLRELHQIFGDWTTVLAAYNCGEGNVLKYIRTQKINYLDNFWDLYQKLPKETAFYVPQFFAVLHIVSDPNAYGITLPLPDDPIEAEEVTIDKQIHLKTIAERLSLPVDLLKELNPALRRETTPDMPYAFNVPSEKKETLLAELDEMRPFTPPAPAYVVHRVRRGETLSVIATQYRSTMEGIVALNGLKSSDYLKVGWRLKVPTRQGETLATVIPKPRNVAEREVRYRVRRGDSLWEIARRFGATAKEIQTLNGLQGTHLQVGQALTIRGNSSDLATVKTERYRVLEGDSPYLIAQKHQMELSDLLTLNNLTPRSTIFPGQVLLVLAD